MPLLITTKRHNQFLCDVIREYKKTTNRNGDSEALAESFNREMSDKGHSLKKFVAYTEHKLMEALQTLEASKGSNIPNVYYDELCDVITQTITHRHELAAKLANGDIFSDQDIIDIETASDLPTLIIWGAPGIGKTDIVYDLVKNINEQLDLNLGCIQILPACLRPDGLTLSMIDRDKAKEGLPVIRDSRITGLLTEKDVLKLACKNKDIRDALITSNSCRGSDGGIIFVDEFNHTPHQTMDVMMNLLQHRRFGEYFLAPGWTIIVASNRKEDTKHSDFEWERAYDDCFRHMNYVPTFEQWVSWAEKNNLDQDVIGFLKANQSAWYDMPSCYTGKYVRILSADPRAWTNAAKEISAIIASRNIDDEFSNFVSKYSLKQSKTSQKTEGLRISDKTSVVARNAGTDVAAKFMEYMEKERYLTQEIVDDILKRGKRTDVDVDHENPKIFGDFVCRLLKKLNPSTMTVKEMDNLIDFIMTSEESSIIASATSEFNIWAHEWQSYGFDFLDKFESVMAKLTAYNADIKVSIK